MNSVTAKFKVSKIEIEPGESKVEKDAFGKDKKVTLPLAKVTLRPVVSSDPTHENSQFYKYTPSGEIVLATVNSSAAAAFEIGGEYYVTFTRDTKN